MAISLGIDPTFSDKPIGSQQSIGSGSSPIGSRFFSDKNPCHSYIFHGCNWRNFISFEPFKHYSWAFWSAKLIDKFGDQLYRSHCLQDIKNCAIAWENMHQPDWFHVKTTVSFGRVRATMLFTPCLCTQQKETYNWRLNPNDLRNQNMFFGCWNCICHSVIAEARSRLVRVWCARLGLRSETWSWQKWR